MNETLYLHAVIVYKQDPPIGFHYAKYLARSHGLRIKTVCYKEYPDRFVFRNWPASVFSHFIYRQLNDQITLVGGPLKPYPKIYVSDEKTIESSVVCDPGSDK